MLNEKIMTESIDDDIDNCIIEVTNPLSKKETQSVIEDLTQSNLTVCLERLSNYQYIVWRAPTEEEFQNRVENKDLFETDTRRLNSRVIVSVWKNREKVF